MPRLTEDMLNDVIERLDAENLKKMFEGRKAVYIRSKLAGFVVWRTLERPNRHRKGSKEAKSNAKKSCSETPQTHTKIETKPATEKI